MTPKTPLGQRYLEDLQLRNYSPKTQQVYLECVSHFARYFRKSPDRLGPEEIRTCQFYLVHQKKASWSRFNQTVCALRFLFGKTLGKDWAITHILFPRTEKKLPVVLSPPEVVQFFGAIDSFKYRTLLMTAYAAGLRLSEVLHLRVSDIDSERRVIRVHPQRPRGDAVCEIAGAATPVLETVSPPDLAVCRPGRTRAAGAEHRASRLSAGASGFRTGKESQLPQPAPLVCDPFARGRCRSAHPSTAAGPHQPVDDGPLPACLEGFAGGHRQPVGRAAAADPRLNDSSVASSAAPANEHFKKSLRPKRFMLASLEISEVR
ncbi:MAG: hypothetical protein FJW26_10100 [Acidimicrobiia bacterium]|nr:hypothetical protein [Acidimicrobiia bacterium]